MADNLLGWESRLRGRQYSARIPSISRARAGKITRKISIRPPATAALLLASAGAVVGLAPTAKAAAAVTASTSYTASGTPETAEWKSSSGNVFSWNPSTPGISSTADVATLNLGAFASSTLNVHLDQNLTLNTIDVVAAKTGTYSIGTDTARKTVTWVDDGSGKASLTFEKSAANTNVMSAQFLANCVLNTNLVANYTFNGNSSARLTGIISGTGKLTVNLTNGNDGVAGGNIFSLGTAGESASTYTGGTVLHMNANANWSPDTFSFAAQKTNAFGTGALSLNHAAMDLRGNAQTVGGLDDGADGSKILNTGSLQTLTLNFSADKGPFTYQGTIGGGAIALTKTGTGVQTLSGANTYTGGTGVLNGALIMGISNSGTTSGAAGPSTVAVTLGDSSGSNSASLLTAANVTFANPITVASGTTGNTLALGGSAAGTSNFTGNITLNKAVTLQAANGGTVNFSTGTFTTNNNLISIGSAGNAGTVNLNHALSTSAGVAINAGTLGVNAALTGPAAINTGGTLRGTGSISGAVAVNPGGTITAGADATTPGQLTTGAQTWHTGGTYLFKMNDATGAAGTASGWDKLDMNGVAVNGSGSFTIQLASFNGASAGAPAHFDDSGTYQWIIADVRQGTIDTSQLVLDATGFTAAPSASFFSFSTGGDGNGGQALYLNYAAAPEASSLLLLGLSLGGLGLRRRRHPTPAETGPSILQTLWSLWAAQGELATKEAFALAPDEWG